MILAKEVLEDTNRVGLGDGIAGSAKREDFCGGTLLVPFSFTLAVACANALVLEKSAQTTARAEQRCAVRFVHQESGGKADHQKSVFVVHS